MGNIGSGGTVSVESGESVLVPLVLLVLLFSGGGETLSDVVFSATKVVGKEGGKKAEGEGTVAGGSGPDITVSFSSQMRLEIRSNGVVRLSLSSVSIQYRALVLGWRVQSTTFQVLWQKPPGAKQDSTNDESSHYPGKVKIS
jgi:hypothetical protein